MLVEPSKSARRLVGRLDAGSDVVAELTRLCELQAVAAGEIRFYGTIASVKLLRLAGQGFEAIPLDESASFDIVQGVGRVAKMGSQVTLALQTMLCADGPAGQQFVFGHLKAAQSVDVEFVIEVFEDIELRRELDPETGRLIVARIHRDANAAPPVRERSTPERIAEAKLAPPTPVIQKEKLPAPDPDPVEESEAEEEPLAALSWEDAAKASDEIAKPAHERRRKTTKLGPRKHVDAEDEDDAELMRPGDVLDHPKLGRCRVIRIEDEDYVHIRLNRGQIRKLSLEVCQIIWVSEEDGRNVFKVRIRK